MNVDYVFPEEPKLSDNGECRQQITTTEIDVLTVLLSTTG